MCFNIKGDDAGQKLCLLRHSDTHIAAHQGRRRKKAAADPVARLEEDLLRASHGIEAELYQDL